jgi:hypothetical protein
VGGCAEVRPEGRSQRPTDLGTNIPGGDREAGPPDGALRLRAAGAVRSTINNIDLGVHLTPALHLRATSKGVHNSTLHIPLTESPGDRVLPKKRPTGASAG